MHEFGIAESMLDAALKHVAPGEAARIVRMTARVGALSGVVEEALRFALEALAAGTPAEGVRLVVEPVPVTCYCAACSKEFDATPLNYQCPDCGRLSGEVRKGRELNLVSIEVV